MNPVDLLNRVVEALFDRFGRFAPFLWRLLVVMVLGLSLLITWWIALGAFLGWWGAIVYMRYLAPYLLRVSERKASP